MLDQYRQVLSKLRTDASPARWSARTCHRAPHKPLLLLSVMDLLTQGSITSNLVELGPELGRLFALYWTQVMPPGRRGNLAMPFFHLKSDGFWHLVPQPGKEAFLVEARRIHSIHQLRDTVLGAKLDEELFVLLCAQESRDLLRTVLIETYFAPDLQPDLVEQGLINVESFQYSLRLLEQARTEKAKERPEDEDQYRPAVRDQGFRRAVTSAYDHRCAFCGIRMLTPDGHTAVDAAHIIPWSISHDDDPRNGMALCRLCHWTFDEGLFGVSSQYLVITSPQLAVNDNVPGHLLTLADRTIIGPAKRFLWPDLDALRWHRRQVCLRR
jgi:putative restriction endonuclease